MYNSIPVLNLQARVYDLAKIRDVTDVTHSAGALGWQCDPGHIINSGSIAAASRIRGGIDQERESAVGSVGGSARLLTGESAIRNSMTAEAILQHAMIRSARL